MCIPSTVNRLSFEDATFLFAYDPETGEIFHRKKPTSKMFGTNAVTVRKSGYAQLHAFGKSYPAHRIAWLLYYKKYPNGVVDHINGNKSDNRICNLRDVSQKENLHNRIKCAKNNSSGLIGVLKDKKGYQSRITVDGKRHYLGWFKTAQEAHLVYMEAKRSLHGFFFESKQA